MRRLTLAVLPVVALLLLAVAAVVPATTDEARAPGSVDVDQVVLACPAGDDLTVTAGQVTAGDAAEATTLPDREDVSDLADATTWRSADVDADDVLLRQDGARTGAVAYAAGEPTDGSLALGACPGVVDDAWFTGLGSTSTHDSTLVLTNLADAPAVADLTVWGPEGLVEAVDATGVVVEPFTSRRITVADLATGEDELAVRVERRRGALAVTALDELDDTVDLVPTATPPSRSLLVGPLETTGDDRTLRLVNPTDTTARVDVEALGSEGAFVPEGLEEVEVGAGRTREVELPAELGEEATTLRLGSTAAITGSVLTTGDDTTLTPATAPWTGPAVVPLDLDGPTLENLVLTAPTADTQVSIAALDASGEEVDATRTELAPGSSAQLEVEDLLDLDGAVHLVVDAGGSAVGSALFADGDARAALALTSAPVVAEGPAVRSGAPRR